MSGIIDGSFVRQAFYVEPPKSGSAKEWLEWLKEDSNKARAAKAAHTKATKQAEVPDEFQSDALVRGSDGTWRQGVRIGFSGDFENDNGTLEVVVEPKQERETALAKMGVEKHKSSCKSKAKSHRRRKNRKKRRKR